MGMLECAEMVLALTGVEWLLITDGIFSLFADYNIHNNKYHADEKKKKKVKEQRHERETELIMCFI